MIIIHDYGAMRPKKKYWLALRYRIILSFLLIDNKLNSERYEHTKNANYLSKIVIFKLFLNSNGFDLIIS